VIDDFLTRLFVNQWMVFLLVALSLLVLGEAGFRFGAAARRRNPAAAEGHSGSVQGAVLGLLGLLLGFSFAMAVGRNETRRALTVDEANSIGTTWLRADFLDEPERTEVRSLLRRYTQLHLDSHDVDGGQDVAKLLAESTGIQNRLWAIARQAAAGKPDAVTVSFITTLNETIDLQASRLAARRNHVPEADPKIRPGKG
jgi:hypothetical protein